MQLTIECNMKNSILVVFLFLLPILSIGQVDTVELSFDTVEYQKVEFDVFEEAPSAKFKLNYYHTDGYSNKGRYWYEVIIIDSLLILNFKSPDCDDWNYINYQKRMVMEDEVVEKLKRKLVEANLQQKREGIPVPPGSGYGADRLFVDYQDISLAGGTVYMCIGESASKEAYENRIKREKEISSSISGAYQSIMDLLETLFDDLAVLLKSKNKHH